MATERELPPHVREWERTNPKAFEIYQHELMENPIAHIPEVKRKVENVANNAVETVNSQHQNVWRAFKSAANQLDDPNDQNQIIALYDAMYDKLDFESKRKLAYHMAY
jgi:hypothetical protein